MILSVLSFVAGIVLVILGADWLTKGASALARRFKISELVIGLHPFLHFSVPKKYAYLSTCCLTN